jgi:hypothetical protein
MPAGARSIPVPVIIARMNNAAVPGAFVRCFAGYTAAEGTGFEPATPLGASEFESWTHGMFIPYK